MMGMVMKIEIYREGWRHSDDGINIVDYPVGVYEIVKVRRHGAMECTETCAKVAIEEGYAVPLDEARSAAPNLSTLADMEPMLESDTTIPPGQDSQSRDGSQTGPDPAEPASEQAPPSSSRRGRPPGGSKPKPSAGDAGLL